MLLYIVFISLFYFAQCDPHDGGAAPWVLLNDGNTMPVLGLGTFLGFDENGQKQVREREIEEPVSWALSSGYRLFDTASAYNNEAQFGAAIQKSSVSRDDIFIVTKVAINEKRNVKLALENSLARLNMSYVDLYLIHSPISYKSDFSEYDVIDYLDTWRDMEEMKREGFAKSIGISNFNISQMERLMNNAEIKPAVLQVEVNLNLAQDKIIEFTRKHNISVMAYSPFGQLFDKNTDYPPPKVNDSFLTSLAKKYKKTVPQIVLRYLVQHGVIPIPKSIRKVKIQENIDIFDFELSSGDVETLATFNLDHRTVWPSWWQDHPYYPFELKDVPDPNLFEKH